MRFTKTSLTDNHHRTALIGANGFDSFKQVMRRVGDFEELLCRDLSGSGVGVVRKLNGGTFEAPATKFFT